jgi:hypothetical protein
MGYGSVNEKGSNQVDAIGNGTELRVEDSLSDPDEQGDVDEDIDGRCIG